MRNAILNGVLILMTAAFAPPVDSNGLINIGGIIYTSSGNYFIEENEDGIFLKTNDEWVWQLQGDDLDQLKPGDTGAFFLDKFSDPPYILLDKNLTFYITNKEILDEFKISAENEQQSMTIHTMRGDDHYVNHWSGSSFTTQEIRDARSEHLKKRKEKERLEKEANARKKEEDLKRQIIIEAFKRAEHARQLAIQANQRAAEAKQRAAEAKQEAERAIQRADDVYH